MSLANTLTSLLTGLTQGQVSAMSAADRQRLDNQCERVRRMIATADLERPKTPPKTGVLAAIYNGERAP